MLITILKNCGFGVTRKSLAAYSLLFACLLLLPAAVYADAIERESGEALTTFVLRQAPAKGSVAHTPIETSAWKFNSPVILAFYEQLLSLDDKSGVTKITGYAFIPVDNLKYEKIEIDTFEPEGGNPRIETVFFSRTDKTEEKKLILIVSWEQNHATVKGTLYATFIYAGPNPGTSPQKLAYLQSMSEQLSGGCDCKSVGEPPSKAKYKNASDIKAALKKFQ